MTSLRGRGLAGAIRWSVYSPALAPTHLPSPLPGLAGCSESEDGAGAGAEGRAAEVSLEEALVRLAEFLSVQLGAEESCGYPLDLSKVSRAQSPLPSPGSHIPVPAPAPCILILISFTAWRCSPAVDHDWSALGPLGVDSDPKGEAGPTPGNSASLGGAGPHSCWCVRSSELKRECRGSEAHQNLSGLEYRVPSPTLLLRCPPYFRQESSVSPNWVYPTPGPTCLEESPSLSLRGEAQGLQPPQSEEDQRAWQRLEQLILGQVRSPGGTGNGGGLEGRRCSTLYPFPLPAGRAEAAA